MYFTQNLLENWILRDNLVVDKTLRKLCKPTTSRDNDICYCYLLLVEQRKGCKKQSLSADQRGQRQSKNAHNKETKRKKCGKKSCVLSSFMSLVVATCVLDQRRKPVGLTGTGWVDRPVGLPVGSRFFNRPVKPVKTPVKFSFLATKRQLRTNRNKHTYFIINNFFCKKGVPVLRNHTFENIY